MDRRRDHGPEASCGSRQEEYDLCAEGYRRKNKATAGLVVRAQRLCHLYRHELLPRRATLSKDVLQLAYGEAQSRSLFLQEHHSVR